MALVPVSEVYDGELHREDPLLVNLRRNTYLLSFLMTPFDMDTSPYTFSWDDYKIHVESRMSQIDSLSTRNYLRCNNLFDYSNPLYSIVIDTRTGPNLYYEGTPYCL